MAPKRNAQNSWRRASAPKDQGKRPQGINNKGPQTASRSSVRLKEMRERTRAKDNNPEPKHSLPSPTNNLPDKEFLQTEDRKRRVSQEDGHSTSSQKRIRISDINDDSTKKINLVEYWTKDHRWPKEYFKSESNMNQLLAKKKYSLSLGRSQLEFGSTTFSPTPSDQKPREVKSAPYTRRGYTIILAAKGSFIGQSDLGITDASKSLCRTLLEAEQSVPQDTLFRDDLFEKTCRKLQDMNEARVIQDIARLIVPSAETLATYGATNLDILIESVNEGWNSAEPFYGPRPQPDYAVGFRRLAFTDSQLDKLTPFVGEIPDTFTSYLMGTCYMYFPFLTCEVKCGSAALDTADRQNAHSMTLAVRGIVELFRLVNREKELHQEILAFSISHNNSSVKIYGHYPIIDGNKTTFYRHPIHTFDFTALDGKEKWTAYKFTKNVYDIWMPIHFKRICSVIEDLLPDLDFQPEASQQSRAPGVDSTLLNTFEYQSMLTWNNH